MSYRGHWLCFTVLVYLNFDNSGFIHQVPDIVLILDSLFLYILYLDLWILITPLVS
jgi:hypothetical protein